MQVHQSLRGSVPEQEALYMPSESFSELEGPAEVKKRLLYKIRELYSSED